MVLGNMQPAAVASCVCVHACACVFYIAILCLPQQPTGALDALKLQLTMQRVCTVRLSYDVYSLV